MVFYLRNTSQAYTKTFVKFEQSKAILNVILSTSKDNEYYYMCITRV